MLPLILLGINKEKEKEIKLLSFSIEKCLFSFYKIKNIIFIAIIWLNFSSRARTLGVHSRGCTIVSRAKSCTVLNSWHRLTLAPQVVSIWNDSVIQCNFHLGPPLFLHLSKWPLIWLDKILCTKDNSWVNCRCPNYWIDIQQDDLHSCFS